MALRGTRAASHAGSWYTANPSELSKELEMYLSQVPQTIDGHSLPIAGARVIIAPHAGYQYSGPCAAWAYRSIDLSRAKRVFVLGPSHTYYLRGCALTTFERYATPFGDFHVDAEILAELRHTGKFSDIPRPNDVREHSLEMHLPYMWKVLENMTGHTCKLPTLVPIMVGDGDGTSETAYGQILLPYLEDPENAFVVSSDFCHWGRNFQYWHYSPSTDFTKLRSLSPHRGSHPDASEPPIHEFIRTLDEAAFEAIESGVQAKFAEYLHLTENTICGRHPISVVMAAFSLLIDRSRASEVICSPRKQKFTFVRYERSNLATTTSDSSVSYGSAYATL